MTQLLIVADDLTGAADTAACFAARGLDTVIPLAPQAAISADVVALSTETRDLPASDAAAAVAAAAARHVTPRDRANPRWLYKKMDSALRGNPRDELLAVMQVSGERRALVAPAFPAEGRTTIGGRQFVNGLPLAESPFGGGQATSDIVAMLANASIPVRVLGLPALRGQPEAIAAILDAGSDGIVIADAATDDDLLALARAARRTSLRLLCGTAGFARALAQTLPLRPASPPHPRPRPRAHPILVVAGSQNAATRRQIDRLAADGIAVVRPTQGALDGGESLTAVIAEVGACLARGHSVAVTTAELAPSPLGGRGVAARLAEVAAAPSVRGAMGGLVLTGGDVAAACLTALRATALRLGGEVAPGQPWGILEGGPAFGLPVATKAGSFGDEEAFLSCTAFFAARHRWRPER